MPRRSGRIESVVISSPLFSNRFNGKGDRDGQGGVRRRFIHWGLYSGLCLFVLGGMGGVRQIVLANFAVTCMVLGIILGIAGIVQERKKDKDTFLK